ncbi:hypothetical protein E2C01_075605 [Portunus trituberculatus]|uniref:Uncharacterized protein n=1 Tax=Portunus trituberculatus TaxID=210409 RepID=A0A5B7IFH0_PORTR|nr:hypothetical protein [Portunus trituberculatus]
MVQAHTYPPRLAPGRGITARSLNYCQNYLSPSPPHGSLAHTRRRKRRTSSCK